jgi:hypothetical protein
MLHQFLFWCFKWLMTVITIGSFVNMVKTVNRPLATRSIVVGRKRFKKTTVDNMMDGAASIWGFIFFLTITGLLWLK